jgi:hypothetical protein
MFTYMMGKGGGPVPLIPAGLIVPFRATGGGDSVVGYIDGWDTGFGFDNPGNAVDGSEGTFAKAGPFDISAYITCDSGNSITEPGGSPSINKVEIRFMSDRLGALPSALFARFDGVDGDSININSASEPWSEWYDITTDSTAPGTWAWSDVATLGAKITTTCSGATDYFQLYKIEIRVSWSALPSGWEIFTDADDKYIIGAGSTYSPGNNGAGDGTINLVHAVGVAHGTTDYWFGNGANHTGTGMAPASPIHATMNFIDPAPNYTENILIKAASDLSFLPQDACFFKHASGGWSGLTREFPAADRFFKANIANATGGKESGTVPSTSEGTHDHGGNAGYLPPGGGTGAYGTNLTKGIHSHSFTAALNFKLYRVQMSMWYMASGAYDLPSTGYIGMYESTTPPDGWSLCNGSGGTPDLRDYFVNVPNVDADAGTVAGDGKVSSVSVTNSAGAHTHHYNTCNSCPYVMAAHIYTQGAHTHTMTHDATWLPPYYALAFIMYTG